MIIVAGKGYNQVKRFGFKQENNILPGDTAGGPGKSLPAFQPSPERIKLSKQLLTSGIKRTKACKSILILMNKILACLAGTDKKIALRFMLTIEL